MNALVYSRKRLTAFLVEIERVGISEFQYEDSKSALQQLHQEVAALQSDLDSLDAGADAETTKEACERALEAIIVYLPLLGFILRSTNVRNPFEVYGPLRRLARLIVDSGIKVLLSSEWEYSPMIYLGIPFLPKFVLIGLPAHESGNPFLIPLAGHELGHAMWNIKVVGSLWHFSFDKEIKNSIVRWIQSHESDYKKHFKEIASVTIEELTDLAGSATWTQAYIWALQQIQEYFCDFVGIRLFGESYFHAFAYLLSSHTSTRRSESYPSMATRVKAQTSAADLYEVPVPSGYASVFSTVPDSEQREERMAFLLACADAAAFSLVPELIRHVDSLLSIPGVQAWKQKKEVEEGVRKVLEDFRAMAPAGETRSLANILNAAQSAAADPEFWQELRFAGSDLKQDKEQRDKEMQMQRDRLLKEIVLKSMEVLEVENKIEDMKHKVI